MDHFRSVLIEFPPTGDSFDAATRVVRDLDSHLGGLGYRVEPLVRAYGDLVGPFSAYAHEAKSYAYRIHLAPLPSWQLAHFRSTVLQPLRMRGVAVDEQVRVAA